jgi:hypothetical protein
MDGPESPAIRMLRLHTQPRDWTGTAFHKNIANDEPFWRYGKNQPIDVLGTTVTEVAPAPGPL